MHPHVLMSSNMPSTHVQGSGPTALVPPPPAGRDAACNIHCYCLACGVIRPAGCMHAIADLFIVNLQCMYP